MRVSSVGNRARAGIGSVALVTVFLGGNAFAAAARVGEIAVDTKAIAVERFLGFGAEWDPQFWADFNLKLGANEGDWATVVRRIRWMKLPFVRMMIQAKWCTPLGDGKFDWNSPAMRSLYRHLDVCRQEGIAVFLTDWGCATWCKVPGFSGNDDPRYADAIGTYLDYLINQKGYSCIRYFILVNEPNYEGGGWEHWKKGVENVAKVLAARKLPVTFVGTDEAHDEAWHRRGVEQLAPLFGVWDLHRYAPKAEVLDGGLERFLREQWDYVVAKDPQGKRKPCIVGEAGMRDGMVGAHANAHIDSYDYGVFMADYAVQAARAGTAAVSAWMLDDSSHSGFKWGMWKNKTEGFALRPWFYTWSLLARCVPAGSTIFKVPQPNARFRILAARLPLRDGRKAPDWTFVLVNRGDAEVALTLRVPGAGDATFRHYLYTRSSAPADNDGFPMPVKEAKANLAEGFDVSCPSDAALLLTSQVHEDRQQHRDAEWQHDGEPEAE